MGVARERPILFSGPMVRAILAGQKTVTRRVVVSRFPASRGDAPNVEAGTPFAFNASGYEDNIRCPYGRPGDRLWVKETHALVPKPDLRLHGNTKRALRPDELTPVYAASLHPDSPRPRWRPSIFMPRWASRLTLEVVSVRVERLQEIAAPDREADALAEGIEARVISDPDGVWGSYRQIHNGLVDPVVDGYDNAREAFANGWDAINGKRPGCAWADNPWVWRVEFRRVEPAP